VHFGYVLQRHSCRLVENCGEDSAVYPLHTSPLVKGHPVNRIMIKIIIFSV